MTADDKKASSTRQPGVRQALAILSALAQEHPLSFSVLLQRCGDWPKATLVRQLRPLIEEGWVEKLASGGYAPGRRYHRAAQELSQRPYLLELLRPVVDRLAQETGQSAAYVEWAPGGGFTFRLKKEMPGSFHHMLLGETNPDIFAHTFGELAFAFQPEPVLREILRKRYQMNAQEIEACKERLAALRNEKFHTGQDTGVRLAAPVFYGAEGAFCGVLGISLVSPNHNESERNRLLQLVTNAAAEASALASKADG